MQETRTITRRCMLCGAQITECMGAVLPRDILAYLIGAIAPTDIRELCAKCNLTWDHTQWTDPRPLPDLTAPILCRSAP